MAGRYIRHKFGLVHREQRIILRLDLDGCHFRWSKTGKHNSEYGLTLEGGFCGLMTKTATRTDIFFMILVLMVLLPWPLKAQKVTWASAHEMGELSLMQIVPG